MRQLTAVLAAALVLLLSGCDSRPADPPAPVKAAEPSAGGPPTGPSGRSLWTLIGDRGETLETLPDDDPDVVAVRKAVALHSATTDNRDHRSITRSTEEEFAFYASEFAESLEKQGYGPRLDRLFRTNELATRQVNTAWYRSTIYRNRATAKAEMDSVLEFTTATPDYLREGGFALNTPYTQHRTVSLAKRDGRWTITAIQKSPMVKGASRPDPSGSEPS
ncbi:hypothetical protein [Streptomyces coelicoflavus]|uniref:hypothetical protein n=1 Tax=Streptomyces coelicoflavus TaxID=285562 RepID=UPI003631CC62